jgi:hypothetical protein
VNIYDVLRRDQRRIIRSLEELVEVPPTAVAERRRVLGVLREQILHQGRAANSLYGALLRTGAHPGAILIAVEAHAVGWHFLNEMERHLDEPTWQGSPELLLRLVQESFAEQAPALELGRELLTPDHARRLAAWHRDKRAAEAGAGLE